MKNPRITILMTTITAFAVALSLVPAASSAPTASTMTAAVRLTTPPSNGPAVIAFGSSNENDAFRNSLTLPPQPTATAPTETPYSRIRSHPMTNATISPSVAYENV